MKTFAQWKNETARKLAEQYDVPISEIDYLDNWRWYREEIQPAMQSGIRPNEDVAKSLAKNAPYSPCQLIREFASYGHGDGFWPVGYDLSGNRIEYTWK